MAALPTDVAQRWFETFRVLETCADLVDESYRNSSELVEIVLSSYLPDALGAPSVSEVVRLLRLAAPS